MRFVLSLLFLLVSIVSSAQLFKGVEHLLKYESYLTDMEMALKSNPLKFNRLHHDLLIVKKSQKDEVLGVALDVYMGSFFYFQNNLDSSRFYFERAMNESSKLGQDQMFRTAKIRKIFSDEYRKTKFQMAQEMTAIYVDSYNKKDTINIKE